MPPGSHVRPKRWTQVTDLYDDGQYSAIWGLYEDDDKVLRPKRVAGRWNGDSMGIGYPNRFGTPQWYVEPEFLRMAILQELERRVQLDEYPGDRALHLANIREALREAQFGSSAR
jgi:hypothetical protein